MAERPYYTQITALELLDEAELGTVLHILKAFTNLKSLSLAKIKLSTDVCYSYGHSASVEQTDSGHQFLLCSPKDGALEPSSKLTRLKLGEVTKPSSYYTEKYHGTAASFLNQFVADGIEDLSISSGPTILMGLFLL